MMKRNHTSLCASAAIAAALALGSTPLLAQAIDVPILAPPEPVAAPPPAPPVAVQPQIIAAQPQIIMVPSEVVQPIPLPAAVPANDPAPTTTATARRAAAPAQTAANVAPIAAPVAEPEAAVESAAIAPAPPLAVAREPVQPTQTQDSSGALLAVLLGGIAVIALAIWGFVAIGRRRTPAQRVAVPVVERPVVAKPAPVAAAPQPVWASPRPAAAPPAASLAHSGASVALPRTVPATFEERDALLKRMIAAKPDRANPFVGYKPRLRRARLILQSLGRNFSDTKPWIDLSQYSANWPELARSNTAAA